MPWAAIVGASITYRLAFGPKCVAHDGAGNGQALALTGGKAI